MAQQDNHQPLREPTFYILLSLSPGARHGYAILKDVEALSQGRVQLSTGTLFGALKRLLDDNWIRRVEDPKPNGTARKRKAYALTGPGQRALNTEIERMRTLVLIAEARTAGETL